MAFHESTALLHISLSRRVVRDVAREQPAWAPAEFYAAFGGMDSAENCMAFIEDREVLLRGWRLFSAPGRKMAGEHFQMISGFEPLVIRGEAIAYARPAGSDRFFITAEATASVIYRRLPQELIDLLRERR